MAAATIYSENMGNTIRINKQKWFGHAGEYVLVNW